MSAFSHNDVMTLLGAHGPSDIKFFPCYDRVVQCLVTSQFICAGSLDPNAAKLMEILRDNTVGDEGLSLGEIAKRMDARDHAATRCISEMLAGLCSSFRVEEVPNQAGFFRISEDLDEDKGLPRMDIVQRTMVYLPRPHKLLRGFRAVDISSYKGVTWWKPLDEAEMYSQARLKNGLANLCQKRQLPREEALSSRQRSWSEEELERRKILFRTARPRQTEGRIMTVTDEIVVHRCYFSSGKSHSEGRPSFWVKVFRPSSLDSEPGYADYFRNRMESDPSFLTSMEEAANHNPI